VETTHAGALAAGHRTIRTKNGRKVRFDMKKMDPRTGKIVDEHWHVENPNSIMGDKDKYIDKFGSPTFDEDVNAHMSHDDLANLLDLLGDGTC